MTGEKSHGGAECLQIDEISLSLLLDTAKLRSVTMSGWNVLLVMV